MDTDPSDEKAAEPGDAVHPSSNDGPVTDGICAKCGRPLIPGGAPGECLRCLVDFASGETFGEESESGE